MIQTEIDTIKNEFRRLVAESFGSEQMFSFLLNLHEEADLPPEDEGWVLWNICDWYAVAREANTQHKYQSEFSALVNRSFPERAHWVVSDGSHAMTLIHGGFQDFWWRCYQRANYSVPRIAENRGVRFESYRANVAACIMFREIVRAESALELMASLLEEDSSWCSQDFASVTYMTLLLEFYAATGQTDKVTDAGNALERILDGWYGRVANAQIVESEERPLFGSWEGLNADRAPANAFAVGVNNAACEFAKAGSFPAAERMFRMWLKYRGKPLNDYGQALFLLSCWRNGRSTHEIIHMLDQSKLTLEKLNRFAPELVDVLRDKRCDIS